MWKTVDQATKDRLEAEYQTKKEAAAVEKAEYEEQYGKIERKKKKKRIAKDHNDEQWFSAFNFKRTVGCELGLLARNII